MRGSTAVSLHPFKHLQVGLVHPLVAEPLFDHLPSTSTHFHSLIGCKAKEALHSVGERQGGSHATQGSRHARVDEVAATRRIGGDVRDPLTGLRNRRYVDEELPALIAADPDLTVAIADIDHFKRINDELSHDVGDQVLVQVAKLLDTELAAVAPDGFAARLGGEEFLLVLPATPVTLAATQLDGIRRAISDHDWHGTTNGLPVTVSIGVAGVSETTPRSQAAALATADRNLYAAKHAGRNRVVAGTAPEPRPRAYRDRDAP